MKTLIQILSASLMIAGISAAANAQAGAWPPPASMQSIIKVQNNSQNNITVNASPGKNTILSGNTPKSQVLKPNQSATLTDEGDTWNPPSLTANVVPNVCSVNRAMGLPIQIVTGGNHCTISGDTVIVHD